MMAFLAFKQPFHTRVRIKFISFFVRRHTMCLVVSMRRMKQQIESFLCVLVIIHLLNVAKELLLNRVYS